MSTTNSELNASTTATGTGINGYCYACCSYKLPCGYCKELGRVCPMTNSNTITWNGTGVNKVDGNYSAVLNKVET